MRRLSGSLEREREASVFLLHLGEMVGVEAVEKGERSTCFVLKCAVWGRGVKRGVLRSGSQCMRGRLAWHSRCAVFGSI